MAGWKASLVSDCTDIPGHACPCGLRDILQRTVPMYRLRESALLLTDHARYDLRVCVWSSGVLLFL